MRTFKCFAFALAAVAVAALLGSCFSMGGGSYDSSPSAGSPKVPDIAAGEVLSLGAKVPAGAAAEIGLYWKVNALSTLLDRFDIHSVLSLESKRALMDALFGAVPSKGSATEIAEIWVGKCVGGKDLGLRAAAVELTDAAKAKGGLYGYLVLSNVIKIERKDGTTELMQTGAFTQINIGCLFIVAKGGKLLPSTYLSTPEKEAAVRKEAKGDATMEAINLADLYLKDQIDEDDAKVPGMLTPLLTDAALPPELRIAAGLNLVLLELAAGDLEKADALIGFLETLCAEVTDPDILEAVRVQAPAMLALMKAPALAD